MIAQPCRCRISIDVEGEIAETRQCRADELTAEGKDQAIVDHRMGVLPHPPADGPRAGVQTHNIAEDSVDADRRQHLVEGYAHVPEVRLVIADADIVIGGSVDERHGRFPFAADLSQLALRGDSRPETGKAAAQHEYPLHAPP